MALNMPSVDAERSEKMQMLREKARMERTRHGWEMLLLGRRRPAAVGGSRRCRALYAAGTAAAVAGAAVMAIAVYLPRRSSYRCRRRNDYRLRRRWYVDKQSVTVDGGGNVFLVVRVRRRLLPTSCFM